MSTDADEESAFMYFYASDGTVRGLLSLSADRIADGIMVRATSASRFVNAVGAYTTTLPGERRIVRQLFSSLNSDFDEVTVLFKPRYIRLRKGSKRSLNSPVSVTMFVAEVRGQSGKALIAFLQNWASETQFGSGFGLFGMAQLPPLSTEATRDGIQVRTTPSGGMGEGVIVASVRQQGSEEFADRFGSSGRRKVIVVISATQPEQGGTIAVLER